MAKPHKTPTPPAPQAPKPQQPAPAATPAEPRAAESKPLTYTQKVLIAVGISAAAILLTAFLFYIAHVLVLVFAGMLLAVFISAPSDLLVKHTRLTRTYALLLVLAGMVLIVFGGGYLMGKTVVQQSRQMGPALSGALNQVKSDLQKKLGTSTKPATPPVIIVPESPDLPPAIPPATLPITAATSEPSTTPSTATAPATAPSENTPEAQHWLAVKLIEASEAGTEFLFSEKFLRGASNVAGGFVSSTFAIVADFTIIFGVGLFFAINPRLYSQGVVKLLPISRRQRSAKILEEVGTQLEWWFVGQLCSMASIGLLTFIGLKILGIPMAATLAILAGLLNFIPNFGPIIAAAPAVLIAFAPVAGSTQLRPEIAGWTIVIYVIIQLLEGWVITPFFQQRAVEIPPALIILAQVIFAMLLGPLGLVLATPMLAAVLVIVRMVYVEDLLGDKKPEKR